MFPMQLQYCHHTPFTCQHLQLQSGASSTPALFLPTLTIMALPSPPQLPLPSPAPPTTTTTTPSITHLDVLLERYLTHLDTYTVLRAQLSTQLSSGFFALARANHTSTSRRYGEEGYDERMKAGRRAVVRRKGTEERGTSWEQERGQMGDGIEYAVETYPAPEGTAAGENDHDHDSEGQVQDTTPKSARTTAENQNPDDSSKAPKAEPNQQPASTTPKPTPSETPTPKSSTPVPLARNPLNWYGILVPPSLRQAQTHFTAAVEGPIPALLNVSSQMAELETQIEDVRRVLGLGLDVREDDEEVTSREEKDETEGDVKGDEAQVKEESTSLRSPKKHLRLAPRSRVLKLDS